ncbi:HEPN domain-containing protein [Nocardioides sp. 1609]|uniref:ApeA N-terminal domain 1-containing protein n=1 Tax=Nocardioides sp. 1609 TaxID=2508327 RepID=UPI00106F8E11|nr:HEPN domain-containing protein [Nocardioides sp. 1609]
MPNKLERGTSRVGELIDFNAETPEVQVTLARTNKGISITIPWSDPTSPYAGWFLHEDAAFGRTRAKAPAPPPVPRRVLFNDSYGPVLLIGVRARGFHANLFGPGSGTLWARAAIIGVHEDADFDQPHIMRSSISGLREWLGIKSWRTSWGADEDPRHLFWPDSPGAIEVGQRDGISLTFNPAWQVDPEEDEIHLRELLWCRTRSDEPRTWEDHLKDHYGVRDLLVLSRWRRETCIVATIARTDDFLPSADDDPSEHWQSRNVVVPEDEPSPPPSRYRPHLMRYADLGQEGIRRWLTLRDEFGRALDPVISCIGLTDATPHTLLAHCGPGLEALGYLLMLRDGASPRAARDASLQSRFQRILVDVGECLPFDGEQWMASTVTTYNGLKHANRTAPDELDVINAWRSSVLVVRAWVAIEIGVDVGAVRERLLEDPQRHPYIAATR